MEITRNMTEEIDNNEDILYELDAVEENLKKIDEQYVEEFKKMSNDLDKDKIEFKLDFDKLVEKLIVIKKKALVEGNLERVKECDRIVLQVSDFEDLQILFNEINTKPFKDFQNEKTFKTKYKNAMKYANKKMIDNNRYIFPNTLNEFEIELNKVLPENYQKYTQLFIYFLCTFIITKKFDEMAVFISNFLKKQVLSSEKIIQNIICIINELKRDDSIETC
jgi:hypothetical protein